MKNKLQIWHILIVIFLLVISFNLTYIYDLILLQIYFVKLALYDSSRAFQQLNLTLLEYLFPLIILLLLPLILFGKRKTIRFIYNAATITDTIIILLITLTVLTPIVAPAPYNFQHNISVSKLLPPFSSKQVIYLNEESIENNATNKFIQQRNFIYNKGFVGKFIIADSIKENGNIVVYQKGNHQIISKEELLNDNIHPKISKIYFLFGTDEYGRDIFSRLIYGTRLSLFVGFGAVFISFIVGLVLGFIAGYFGGLVDTIINRIADIFLSFPTIFLIILIVGLFGNSVLTIITILGFAGWMSLFKIVRNETASIKNKDFINTSKLLGFSNFHILLREMLPVMMPSIIVNLVLLYGAVIIAESALSYLGLGLGNNYPSWGAMIEAGQYYLSKAWWISFFPCLFLFITLFTANQLGKRFGASF